MMDKTYLYSTGVHFFLESLGTTTGPVPCCIKQLTMYPIHHVFTSLHCCWWCSLSWNSLPKVPVSHISTHSLRLLVRVTCFGKLYITPSRNQGVFTPCFLTFWIALYLRDGPHLLLAHLLCTQRRGVASSLFFLPRPFTASPHCCWWMFLISPSLGQEKAGRGKRSREVFSCGYSHGDPIL